MGDMQQVFARLALGRPFLVALQGWALDALFESPFKARTCKNIYRPFSVSITELNWKVPSVVPSNAKV